MLMSPSARKFALTAHISCSAGSLGAIGAFLLLAVAGLTAQEASVAPGLYRAMELTASYAILPLLVASLATGVIQSLGTRWGLFRHYWVVVKLVINLVVLVVLILQMELIHALAAAALEPGGLTRDLRMARLSPVVHSAAGLVVLLVPVALSLYKPAGLTRYGWRKQHEPIGSSRV